MMSSNPLHPLVPGMLFEILCDKVKHEKPLFQVVHFKLTPSTGPSVPNRIKFAISDGKHYSQAVIPPSFYEYLSENPLNIYSIIQLDEYSVQSKADRTFIVISKCNWASAVSHPTKLGLPTNIDSDPSYLENHSDNNSNTTTSTTTLKAQMNANSNYAPPPPQPFSNNANFSNNSSIQPLSSSTMTHFSDPSVCDISTLSPFNNSWTIKARVSNKSDVKHFNSKRTGRDGQVTNNEGKLFSCTLIDNSGEIRITGFNESVDLFYDTIFEGQVYMISGGVVSVAKKSWGVKNDYEIRLEPTSTVTHCINSSSELNSIPLARYQFTGIDSLSSISVPPPSQTPGVWVDSPTTDVIGVIIDISPSNTIVAKSSGKTLIKRDITIGDRSMMSSKVTLWGDLADQYPKENLNSIIAIKGCRVGEFQGMKQLSLSTTSQIAYNPDIKECHLLRGWFDSLSERERSPSSFTPLQPSTTTNSSSSLSGDKVSKRKTIAEIRDSVDNEGTDYCDVLASVLFIKQEGNISYPSCPGESCSKKVFPDNDPNMWRCDRCDKSYPSCLHRYLLNIQVSDPTGPTWMSAFNDAGEIIMGGNSAEKMLYLSENDPNAYKAVFEGGMNRSYVFRCKVKQEPYQGEMKQRCQIISATPVDPVKESQIIINDMGIF